MVIFYSFEGNTRLIGENIAKAVNADILELKLKKGIKHKGFMKYIWGGTEAFMKAAPELLPFDKNIQDYDVFFIGTPVWAWTYAPALNTFFSSWNMSSKKIALFCCHGGQPGKIFSKIKERLKGNRFLGEMDFNDPLRNNTGENIQKARKWVENMIKFL